MLGIRRDEEKFDDAIRVGKAVPFREGLQYQCSTPELLHVRVVEAGLEPAALGALVCVWALDGWKASSVRVVRFERTLNWV